MYGINLVWCSNNNIISGNTANNNFEGISLDTSNNSKISGNLVDSNTRNGINLWISNNNTIEGNDANNNNDYGIFISTSYNNSISENTANYNDNSGINLRYSNNNSISENTGNYNDNSGIGLYYSDNNTISGNYVRNNTRGIYLLGSNNNTISENTGSYNDYGIILNLGNVNNISGNYVINNTGGIYLWGSNNNTVSGNMINYNTIGLNFLTSNYNTIINNNLQQNIERAVIQKDCTENTFRNNIGIEGAKFPIILLIFIGVVVIIVITGVVVLKKRISFPKKEKITKEQLKEEKRLKEERLKKEKEQQKLKEKERKLSQEFQKRLLSVDILIKENDLENAIRNLVEIQKEAQIQGLKDIVNKAEEKIINCKRIEMKTIDRIKMTIIRLGAKFTRLQLVDISDKCGIKDEALIERVILDMIKNKEIFGEYFSTSKALSLETTTPIPIEEEVEKLNVFISYSTKDTHYFQISKIVRRLELYPEINDVLFWEVDSKQNIVEFMEETLNKTKVFVLFCSENSKKSEAVKGEWQSAYQMAKKGLMKIVPVYEDENLIPKLLWQMLNVKFTKDNFEGFIQKLYEEILR
jgi:parallel beta-helix repeat protein